MVVRVVRMGVLSVLAVLWLAAAVGAERPDRRRIEDFLHVTGFDVALESTRLSAGMAPSMLGMETEDFGNQWAALTRRIFDTERMHAMALDTLEKTLSRDSMEHALVFYTTDLGQRIVQAENASHMTEDDAAKREAGEAIVSAMVRHGSDRLKDLQRMARASDSGNVTIRAMQELQARFLLAAADAGVVELRMDEAELRAFLAQTTDDMRRSIQLSSLSNAAFTYQAFSDEEVADYADALEHPKMQEVYDLMNAVQFEVMANRFEALAAELAKLQPSTDL